MPSSNVLRDSLNTFPTHRWTGQFDIHFQSDYPLSGIRHTIFQTIYLNYAVNRLSMSVLTFDLIIPTLLRRLEPLHVVHNVGTLCAIQCRYNTLSRHGVVFSFVLQVQRKWTDLVTRTLDF